nr:MAG TPA: hypothetical protein [Caudoviricetes sp.]DAZ36026.1 MAG TPA: hypothetical protein [Caudoviricetes sp.]
MRYGFQRAAEPCPGRRSCHRPDGPDNHQAYCQEGERHGRDRAYRQRGQGHAHPDREYCRTVKRRTECNKKGPAGEQTRDGTAQEGY